MTPRDFGLMTLVCLIWAANTIVSKLVIANLQAPPMFYAALRFAVVLAVVWPWLRNAPRPLWRMILVGLCMGSGTFALVFFALKTASPSAVAIVSQMGVPVTAVLSWFLLGERLDARRITGTAMTLAGVVLVMWNPDGLHMSAGLLFVVASAVIGSFGAVLMKQIEGVKPLQFQAWVGLSSVIPTLAYTLSFETGHATVALANPWALGAAVLFSGLVVSVLAHTLYYTLIQRYEASLVSPLTLMTPIFTIALGVVITGDVVDLRMALGAVLALIGVLVTAFRFNQLARLALVFGRGQG
ncbi:MAG: EamA family transporter [Phenylobacterium sp.]|jgi:O-acetylserine/cysteine efflux transporter|uniref:DMT family transporter n=1 Tax=Phenylobacterium sp. TaxID=1871053 RepID=UPI0025FF5206|nr:EamA family transporter [Phenylobacterium sp.]MCA3711842.1 EamA family transporter [Phenylobacterium sp.]MCA3714042.1 EamA family transporter [Phenylobacterium sp.]MCA3723783.1 EamA family transporter [Phenylobacterium sp.]MCA3725752.1 EamA family transporter [Phenylobacterium sp.]MCA3729335.1 EamA family transporter [Phenylobacterium sp.]